MNGNSMVGGETDEYPSAPPISDNSEYSKGIRTVTCEFCGCLIIDGACWCDIEALIDEMEKEVEEVNGDIAELTA